MAPTELAVEVPRRGVARFFPYLALAATLWLTWLDGCVPSFLSPTAERTLYFKLPIDGTRFHWTFLDRRAFLAGELTLRIVNTNRDRDQTILIFRNGKISDGWTMIGDMRRDSSFYFGFSTDQRFPTAVGDSLIITLVAAEDLRGRGPYATGTLAKGRWVATGTYSALYGRTLNPLHDLVSVGQEPIAFLECWDTTWVLQDRREVGWMGERPADEDDVSLMQRIDPPRGVDGRLCRSKL